MKLAMMHYVIVMLNILSSLRLFAADLNITASDTRFISANYVFKKNDQARGFIRFNSGFTVMPDARVSMDVPLLVLGPLDLRETGTIRLISDLFLDSSVTLTSGGRIDGQGHRVVCNGDFAIPSGKILHINGNTILDMDNHSLMISDNAQIFVDTNITLTIANATIRNGQHSLTVPPLRCGALNSKLALNNVTFCPIGDFLFPQGQLFVHNDVAFTGTSAFIYTSPVPGIITSNSCLYFDKNTTLSVAPSTFTNAPYTLKNTYTRSNFIQCVDATAALYLNGCSLLTTLSGVRFTNGNIFLDNHVVCKSDTTVTMTSITLRAKQDYGSNAYSVHWSPDGKYLAVGGNGPTTATNDLQLYSFNGTALTFVQQRAYGSSIFSVQWSADGKFLAIGGNVPTGGNELQVYSFFNGSLSTSPVATFDFSTNGYVRRLNWSPDGRYLAAGGYDLATSFQLQAYSFNGSSLKRVATVNLGGELYPVAWSPDGQYVAAGGNSPSSGYEVQVYSFSGTALTLVTDARVDYGSNVIALHWSPDGRYLAIGGTSPTSGYEVQVWRFSGTNLVLVPGARVDYGSTVNSVNWSHDGRYLAIAGSGPSPSAYEVQVYSFNGTALTLVSGAQIDYGAGITSVSWSQDGRFLALGGSGPNAGHEEIEVYRVDSIVNTAAQAYSSSIVFGDSRYGTSRDAMVTVLAGARVDLTGKMMNDNFNG